MLLRRIGELTAAFVCLLCSGVAALAQSPKLVPVVERHAMHATRGRVTGSVSDEHGGPLPGAMVSMLGVTMATAIADDAGHFTLEALPVGEYILRAHMTGFAASPRQLVKVGAAPTVHRLQLRRLDGPVATAGITPVEARPIVAAGFGASGRSQFSRRSGADGSADPPTMKPPGRLRHIQRSILKDRSNSVILAESEPPQPETSSFARAFNRLSRPS